MSRQPTSIAVSVRSGGDAWITIDRARKHNALSRAMLAALADAVTRQAAEPSTRCIVVRGAGDRYFAAGGDIVDLAQVRTQEETEAMTDEATAALDAIRFCEVPVIAYANGDALGGGAELAVACDMRVVAAHARIGFVHGRLAITPAWGGATDLCQLVGSSRAMRMMARSELVDAEQALAFGLADAIARDGPDGADMSAFLQPLREHSPAVLRAIKAQVAAGRKSPAYLAQREVERRHFVATWVHADHWAAVERFLARE
jgi:enoyl-CoA hydratase